MTPHPSRRVTVWLDGRALDTAALDQAAAACRVRRLPLRLLYAVPPADPWSTGAQRWLAGAATARLLGDAFRHVRACWPGVPVTARLVEGGVGDALAGSDLLVVGGDRAGVPSSSCPVVVVDH
jgi:hypothetical protein